MQPNPTNAGSLLLLGEELGYPGVSGVVTPGARAWRQVLIDGPILTPPGRARFLVRLGRHVQVLNAHARGRLRRWLDGPRTVPTLVETRERLLYCGDLELLEPVVEAFMRVPPYVRDVLLDEVAVLGVGVSSVAWTASATFRDVHGQGRSNLIVLSGKDRTHTALVATTLHELGHRWVARPASGESFVITSDGEQGFVGAMAATPGGKQRFEAWWFREELRAEALAFVWGVSRYPLARALNQ